MGRSIARLALLAGLYAGAAQADVPPEVADPGLAFNTDPSLRLTLPIAIGGKGPYRFLVDTGSERTILSHELARELALAAGKPVRLLTATGSSEVGTVTVPDLDMGKRRRMKTFIAPLLDAHAIGAAGLLGIDSLQAQQVEFDFVAMTMRVSRPSRAGPHAEDEIVVTARKRIGRLIFGEASVEKQPVQVVLDTGAQLTIGNETLRRKLIEHGRLGPTRRIELMSVTGEKMAVDYALVRRFQLGSVRIDNIWIAFADLKPFAALDLADRPAMLLGMDTLRLFDRVSVDFANRRVRFDPPGGAATVRATRMAAL